MRQSISDGTVPHTIRTMTARTLLSKDLCPSVYCGVIFPAIGTFPLVRSGHFRPRLVGVASAAMHALFPMHVLHGVSIIVMTVAFTMAATAVRASPS